MRNNHLIGIDIGGTKIRAVAFDGENVLNFKEIKTPGTKELFLNAILELINFLDSNAEGAKKIGIAFAGLTNKDGKILQAPNLKFLQGTNLADFINNKFNIEVLIDNDANCFLRAEKKLGVVKNYSNITALTIGTGLGGAIMIDNKIINGANRAAGEIGNSVFPKVLILKEKKGSYTLKWDKFESFVSKKWFEEFKFKGVKKNVKEIAEMAKIRDSFACHIFDEFGVNLAFVISVFVNIFDPETVLIGGGISKAKSLFYSSFKIYVKKFIFSEAVKKNLKIFFSDNDNSAAIGAALLFTENNNL